MIFCTSLFIYILEKNLDISKGFGAAASILQGLGSRTCTPTSLSESSKKGDSNLKEEKPDNLVKIWP